jgi:hypothetical protein
MKTNISKRPVICQIKKINCNRLQFSKKSLYIRFAKQNYMPAYLRKRDRTSLTKPLSGLGYKNFDSILFQDPCLLSFSHLWHDPINQHQKNSEKTVVSTHPDVSVHKFLFFVHCVILNKRSDHYKNPSPVEK